MKQNFTLSSRKIKKFLLKYRPGLFGLCGIWLSVVYCANGVQRQDSTMNYICGTISESGGWKKDDHFGDNQELVDNLIAHNVAIDRNYLDKLETRDVLPRMTKD